MNWSQPHQPHQPHQPVESPPPTVPDGASVDQEERLVAACTYLSWLVGFWIIGPVALYLLYREKSRYVAFHAIQSIVVSIGLTVIAPVLWLGGTLVVFLIAFANGGKAAPALMMFGIYGTMIIAMLIPLVWMLIGAWRAFQGQRWRVPIAWRIAKHFIKDDGQSPQQPSPFQQVYPGGPR